MAETDIDLGVVTAPSGVLVLGMASWIDYWPQLGRPLSERASAAASVGGGHVHDRLLLADDAEDEDRLSGRCTERGRQRARRPCPQARSG
ncbi:hypothetical protein [Streptomyces virginiae]|uniref:hypothetical protein n=1 Tax=Streptomyces virginiae TaxID=1961 RepID=UPI0036F706AF